MKDFADIEYGKKFRFCGQRFRRKNFHHAVNLATGETHLFLLWTRVRYLKG